MVMSCDGGYRWSLMVEPRRRDTGRLEGRIDGRWRTDVERGDAQGGYRKWRNVKAAALERDLGRKVALPWRPGESSVAAERKGGSGGVDWPFKEQRGCLPSGGGSGQLKPALLLEQRVRLRSFCLVLFILGNQRQFCHCFLSFNRWSVQTENPQLRQCCNASCMSYTSCSCIFNVDGDELSVILWIIHL